MTISRERHLNSTLAVLALCLALLAPRPSLGQAARCAGVITSVQDAAITVRTDGGETRTVQMPASAPIRRVAPGQKELSAAQTITLGELAVGDRVSIRLEAEAATPRAAQTLVLKQEDLRARQQAERLDWQKRGVSGLVQRVDTVNQVIEISAGQNKTLAVHLANGAVLRRYAPGSVRFEEAHPAPLGEIALGDQLRARGERSADGLSLEAVEIVSGSFRNLSGVIAATNPAASTVQIKDLATKRTVTLHLTAQSQLRRLPEEAAKALAARLNRGARDPQAHEYSRPGPARPGGPSDPQQLLSQQPLLQAGDLKKGDVIMAVAMDAGELSEVVTLLAGVEPLLQAPDSQSLLADWSLSANDARSDQ